MGNLCSSNRYDRDAVVRSLWKSLRAVPVLPINPNLIPLRVLCKKSDGYHDVGTVYSLCKPGKDKEWLKDVVYPRRKLPVLGRKNKYLLPPKSIGQQTSIVSDNDGALAKALVGPVNAAAWFKKTESIEVSIPECEILEFNKEKWDEMMDHFDPDLQTSILGSADGKRDLFIVQKVLLVSQIKITASYKINAGLDVKTSVMPSQGVNLEAIFRSTSSSIIGEFTLSATQKDQKLPVAFSGFSYTYNKFGIREHFGKETRSQPDGEIGESSGASQADSDPEDDDPVDDPDMGSLLDENDWFVNVIPSLEIYPYLAEPDEPEQPLNEPGEDEEEDGVVDQNAPGLDDID